MTESKSAPTEQTVDSSLSCCRGRLRIYHGVNFVRKEPPWYHEALLEPDHARDLAAWGLTVVRLGTMWSGVEPRQSEWRPLIGPDQSSYCLMIG